MTFSLTGTTKRDPGKDVSGPEPPHGRGGFSYPADGCLCLLKKTATEGPRKKAINLKGEEEEKIWRDRMVDEA